MKVPKFAAHLMHRRCSHCYEQGRRDGYQLRKRVTEIEAELRRRGEPTSADAMDESFRRLIADSETWRGAA